MRSQQERFWEKVNKGGPNGCWVWTAAKDQNGYGRFGTTGTTTVLAHRFSCILAGREMGPGVILDHICRNPSCVNPSHLRICTHAENLRNTGKKRTNTSGFKGVSWHKGARKWRSTIVLNGKQEHLGFFESKDEAHRAYVDGAIRLHGEFANTGDAPLEAYGATEYGVTFTTPEPTGRTRG